MQREEPVYQNILLIQSDPAEANIIRELLANSRGGLFRVEWVGRCCEALEILRRQGNDAIAAVLVDLFLPDSQGIETFEALLDAAPLVPILVLSDARQIEVARQAVQRGAQDYLLKERIDAYLLPKALESMMERSANAEILCEEKERVQIMLNSIGDAVIGTDVDGNLTYLNKIAERMTGVAAESTQGRPLQEMFRIVPGNDRTAVMDPMALAIQQDRIVQLNTHHLLLRRDGCECVIEGSVAPIHDRRGRVTGCVTVLRDVTKAHAMSARMYYLAQHDVLTDLPNRLLFNDRLAQALVMARRHQLQLAVLFVDVDHFKHINDSLGHEAGDKLLQSVARRLINCVRSSDTVSRQGGDEFVVLLAEIKHARDAATLAEKILATLGMPHGIDEHDLHITASIGIAVYPEDGTDVDTLRKNADFAMFHAKDNGRNGYQFFHYEMNVRGVERKALETDLRQALTRGELLLHYQPKMDLEMATMSGVEVLLRWLHPQRGLLASAQFVPIAEESGLIIPIGRWVVSEACRQIKAWSDAGLQPITIAINISALELRAGDFAADVRAALSESGVEPRYLEFELNESFLMQDAKSATTVLQALKGLGVSIALDDFGTGYSSLTSLKRFPINALKIDQSFMRDVLTDPQNAEIVTAVISMGNSLNLRVIAEGVETQEQLQFLRTQSCCEAQGYLFSRPLAAAEFAKLLAPRAQQPSGGASHTL